MYVLVDVLRNLPRRLQNSLSNVPRFWTPIPGPTDILKAFCWHCSGMCGVIGESPMRISIKKKIPQKFDAWRDLRTVALTARSTNEFPAIHRSSHPA